MLFIQLTNLFILSIHLNKYFQIQITMYKLHIYHTINYIALYFICYTTFTFFLTYNLITFLYTHCLKYLPFKAIYVYIPIVDWFLPQLNVFILVYLKT